MKTYFLFLLVALSLLSCDTKLSDEDRKAIKEELETQRITRMTESEIMSRAHETGRLIMDKIDSVYEINAGFEVLSKLLKELSGRYNVRIEWLDNNGDIPENYKELMEAYKFIIASDKDALENIQVLQNKNFLYTRPNVQVSPDTTILKGLWNIELDRKYLVLHKQD